MALTDLGAYEKQLYEFFEVRHTSIMETLTEQKKMDDQLKTDITNAVKEFTEQFTAARKGAAA